MNDAENGRRANKTGKHIAQEVAVALKVKLISEKSNECIYNGKCGVIKSASKGNGLFGITNRMHERIEMVILAVETEIHKFDVYLISLEKLIQNCMTTGERSGKGKVTSYRVSNATDLGNKILEIELTY